MVVMAVQPGHKRGENDVENVKIPKIPEIIQMILDESRKVQEAFLAIRAPLKM